jgi:hypothetical protein
MVRNTICFEILFHENNKLHFSKEAGESNPLHVPYNLSNLSMKVSYSACACTQNDSLNVT